MEVFSRSPIENEEDFKSFYIRWFDTQTQKQKRNRSLVCIVCKKECDDGVTCLDCENITCFLCREQIQQTHCANCQLQKLSMASRKRARH